ncbi:thioredoxin domain-containing protein [Halobacteriales archaeon QH_10_67_22]|nr:MAG: thioredoxin domain-containing protein [Halobacteriales archaeon QH_10_67_22]
MSADADPTERNRLDEEESPYLRQHADNPVNWQPWDEQAFEAARERDVPVFLSIGYAACHWCHVMEEESFQDEEVARLLNEQFVPVKVDREERPDVDSIYMSICQQVTGRGGWPLSAWLTPEGEPFYVGTYFPKEAKRNQPGFVGLLEDIHNSWSDPAEREEIQNRARQWTEAIESDLEETPDHPGELPDSELLTDAAAAALRGADREHGGWGRGQKFPHSGRLHLLARADHADDDGRDTYREVLVEALDAMADGGMYDHLGGGFHRYTVDREWVVPHFEKMLYDNAELARAYLAGFQVTGTDRYRDVATETLGFVERELTHPDGGFYSTLSAESAPPDDPDGDTEEGLFYVWTPAGVHDAVTARVEDDELPDGVDAERAAELFCERYGVTPGGNFENGTTVLTLAASVEAVAESAGLSTGAVAAALDAAKRATVAAREQRPRPPRDEKVLAGWNGLMISAFAEAAVVDDGSWAESAQRALAFVREHLWNAEAGRLSRRYKDVSGPRPEARESGSPGGDVKVTGYLEDYAFLARGAFDTYGATGDVDHLAFALELARVVEAEFWDAEERTLYFTPQSGESLVARPQELTDRSTPSSAGVAAQLLSALDAFVDHDRFGAVAEGVVETHAPSIEADPIQHASLVLAADDLATGHSELTLAGDRPDAWRESLATTYVPRRVLAPRPATDDELDEWLGVLGVDGTPAVWADRSARDGKLTVYACRARACSPPTHDVEEALGWFDGSE